MIKRSQGYYSGKYEIEIERYSGKDFSKKCFIFPGQGVAYPGMMKDAYLQSEIIRNKFIEADRAAGVLGLSKISDYILKPEVLDDRTVHITANLALFTLECALFDVLISRRIIPKMLTGHSFGEYAALVSAGIVSFLDMFDIVYHREISCPAPNVLGYMIAVKADDRGIGDVLQGNEYHVSNLNSPSQTVISVSPENLEKVERALEDAGMKHVLLKAVPQPYHSPYLIGTRNRMADHMKNKSFMIARPTIPLFSSVLKRTIEKDNFKEDDIRTILIDQMVEPVDFLKQIKNVYAAGCFNFLELGPKNIFSGFVREILDGEKIAADCAANLPLFKGKETERKSDGRKGKLFSLVGQTIGKITGYEIEKISFEDRFQEDLGIDSIKKADILLTILDESGINPGDEFNTSQFKSVGDAVRYIEDPKNRNGFVPRKSEKRKADFRRYIFSWKEKNLGRQKNPYKVENEYLAVDSGEIFKNGDVLLEKIAGYLENAPADGRNIVICSDFQEFDYDSSIAFFKFFRAFFKRTRLTRMNLFLVSFGERSACSDGYASFLKSVKKEFPKMFFKYIRFEDEIGKEETRKIILQEMEEPFGEDVLYRDGHRFVNVAEALKPEEKNGSMNGKSVVIAIGGAKGITFSLVKDISEKYGSTIYLLGRSSENEEAVKNNLEELRRMNTDVFYESVDACDRRSLEDVFVRIRKRHGKIDLVVNGAGVVDINFLVKKSDEEIVHEFRNKVLPAVHVLELTDRFGVAKTINFSSIISKYGSAGQSIYTAANAMVDGFSRGKATVIHWPAWDGVGMTADRTTLQKLKEFGVSLLSPEKAAGLFMEDIESHAAAAVYYLDESDDHQLSFSLADIKRYEPLLGKMRGEFDLASAKISFEKTFDKVEDNYLNDHRVGGNIYVPAATGIAMFFCLSDIYLRNNPILKDIAIKNPIIVKDVPVRCDLEMEDISEDGLRLSLKSKLLHFSGAARIDNIKKTPKIVLPEPGEEIEREFLYADYFPKRNIRYGKTFQCAEKAFVDLAGKQFFKIRNSGLLPVLGNSFYDRFIQWVDVSFQALGAYDLEESRKDGSMMIPASISSLQFYSDVDVTDILYVIPNDSETGDGFMKGDVVVANERGEAVLDLKGILLKAITK